MPSLFVRRPSVNISHFNLLLRNHWDNCNETLVEWSLGDPLGNCVRWSRLPTKMTAKLKTEKREDEFKTNLLLWNYWADLNQTLQKWSLGGPLPKFCTAFQTSNQDGRQAINRKNEGWNLKKSSPLKLLSRSQPNFTEMILGWSPSTIMSGISDLRPRWPLQPNLIHIKIFLSGTSCSIGTKLW